MEQCIYCIGEAAGGVVKIGFTKNPLHRLSQVNTYSPRRMYLLGTLPGGPSEEAALHAEFAHLRSHGEWFADEEMLISSRFRPFERPLKSVAEDIPITDLRSWLRARRVTQEDMADRIGITAVKMNKVLMGTRRVTVTEALRIASATGGEVPVHFWAVGSPDCKPFFDIPNAPEGLPTPAR